MDCIAHQAPLSMGFSRQEYWSGYPFSSPGYLPDPRIEPRSPSLQEDSLPSEPQDYRQANEIGNFQLFTERKHFTASLEHCQQHHSCVSLGWEDPLEKEKATHSSTLAWRIPWNIAVHVVTKSLTRLSKFHFTSLHLLLCLGVIIM